jgi:hypothetical protein
MARRSVGLGGELPSVDEDGRGPGTLALVVLAVLVVGGWVFEVAARGTPQCAGELAGWSTVPVNVLRYGPTFLVLGSVLLLGVLVGLRLRRATRSPEWATIVGVVACGVAAGGLYLRGLSECLMLS